MGKLHDVDSINNPGFLIACLQPGLVYITILRILSVFLAVPTQNSDLL